MSPIRSMGGWQAKYIHEKEEHRKTKEKVREYLLPYACDDKHVAMVNDLLRILGDKP